MVFPRQFDVDLVVKSLYIVRSSLDNDEDIHMHEVDSGHTVVSMTWYASSPLGVQGFEERLSDMLPLGTTFYGRAWESTDGSKSWCCALIALPCRLKSWSSLATYLVMQDALGGACRMQVGNAFWQGESIVRPDDLHRQMEDYDGDVVGAPFLTLHGKWSLPDLGSGGRVPFEDGMHMWYCLKPDRATEVENRLLDVWDAVREALQSY